MSSIRLTEALCCGALVVLAAAGCTTAEMADADKASYELAAGGVSDEVEAARDAKGDELANPRLQGALSCGTTARSTFSPDATYHLYTLDGRAGHRLTLDARATDGATDTVVALFEPDGFGPLAVNDDCDRAGAGFTYDSCLDDIELERDGEYLVYVTTYWGDGQGAYALGLGCTGLGRAGDPCELGSECQEGLSCAVAPFGETGECRSAECGGPLESLCINAECVPFADSPDGRGFCHRPTACDDGTEPRCRRMVPMCEPGTILAYQSSCYTCVDPDTCEPPIDDSACAPRGCSGQVCADEPTITTCDFREEYRCVRMAGCGPVDDGCGWQIDPGSAAHECLTELGRCAFDTDCADHQRCTATPGSGYGFCDDVEPTCQIGGCWGEYCGFEPPRGVLCPAHTPAWMGCLRDVGCGAQGDGCGWFVEPGDSTHACLTGFDLCVFDEDCAGGESCVIEYNRPFGHCQSDGGPGRVEGELCNAELPCRDGLSCIGQPHDGSDPFGVCRDTTPQHHEGGQCAIDLPCNPGQVCAGLSSGGLEGFCVPEWMRGTFSNSDPVAIPDNDAEGVRSSVVARGLATVPTDVILHLTIRHTWRGDLVVTLTDPNGQTATVWNRQGGSADDLVLHVPVNGFSMDDSVNGRWTLHVTDRAGLDTGLIESWSLELTSRWD